jgi:hypothetical protein
MMTTVALHRLAAATKMTSSDPNAGTGTGTGIGGERSWLLADITAQSGSSLKTAILGICGTIFVIMLAAKVLNAWAEEKYGKMVTLLVAGAVVAFVVFFPDQAVAVLKNIGSSIGSGS